MILVCSSFQWSPVLAFVALLGSRGFISTFGMVPAAALIFVPVVWTDLHTLGSATTSLASDHAGA